MTPATLETATSTPVEAPRRPEPPGGPSAAGAGVAYPPLTLEGWYAHHQLVTLDRERLRAMPAAERARAAEGLAEALAALRSPAAGGWTAPTLLVGSSADAMLVHFRPTLDELGVAQRAVLDAPLGDLLRPTVTYLSVTEAGMYQVAGQLAKAALARGGSVGDATYEAEAAARLAAEREDARNQKRLYPPLPDDMPYVCFYPMSKRRAVGQNWYEQTLEERNRLMWAHGKTGRRYAGKVFQIITGSVGFDAWEWGVMLFAADPLEIKRIVTEMRFDEVSARYAEFGAFYVGRVMEPGAWVQALVGG
ncbi:putative heme-dependent peroxidase YwfI [Gemmatimonadetes bacterium T265]|nr:putative heme-dependent peroxidase YwfI [Gemmatimonadetes bacterium T265]